MKARLPMLVVSLAVGMALAQTTPADKKNPTAKTQSGSATATTAPAEMKTATYKGVLVDMSCASQSTGGTAAAPANSETAQPAEPANSANRAAGDSGASCPVTAQSTNIGMKLDNGQTVRFDLVGTQRAQDALKNDKGWSKDLSANKPVHAKVEGVLQGDKLIVSSIH
jgi:hypothetical protein